MRIYAECDSILYIYYAKKGVFCRQFLASYRSVKLEAMANDFGVSASFIDAELSSFISSGKLTCKIDKALSFRAFQFRPLCHHIQNIMYLDVCIVYTYRCVHCIYTLNGGVWRGGIQRGRREEPGLRGDHQAG